MIRNVLALLVVLAASDPAPLPPPPQSLGLDPFYMKWLDCDGLPIVSSAKVPDAALHEAARIVRKMVEKRPDCFRAIVEAKVRLAVMAKSEKTTDIPEHSDLSPKEYWDRRARGLGATLRRPAVSGAEENLLGYEDDRYRGECILIHEFAHTLAQFGAAACDEGFAAKLREAYASAMTKGLWKGTYAAENADEYWAEGVQSWFDMNVGVDADTREELKRYDPDLAALIATVLPDDEWRYGFPAPPAAAAVK